MPTQLISYIFAALAALLIIPIHECAHGYVAYKLGDPTAKNLGRLSLNPIKHLDPIGMLCMVVFGFGWARPVPINPRYFKKPKRDFALTALAGPVSNLLSALCATLLYLLALRLFSAIDMPTVFAANVASFTLLFLLILQQINIGFAIFNLLPIPPFDGSRILHVILPERLYFKIMKYERGIYLFVLGWLLLGGLLSNVLLRIPGIADNAVLQTIAHILSLSWLLDGAISFLSTLMFRFFELIPFLRM